MKGLVQFSGGKDSLATLLWAVEKYGKENLVVAFCDTRWEHKITYAHIKEVMERLDIPLLTLKGKYSFWELAKKKLRFPSTKARFCTEFLKIRPMIDWILSQQEHFIVLQGIRAQESESRAKMSAECQYFKYYFEPYTDNKVKLDALQRAITNRGKKGATEKQLKTLKHLQERLSKGKLDEKYFTYRKKDVFKRQEVFATDILRPFFEKTANDVMTFIKGKGFKPNPLYYMGFTRVGCFPCVMCTKGELQLINEREPTILDELAEKEIELGSSFFPPEYIPKKYRVPFITKRGIFNLPTMPAVREYVSRKRYGYFKEEVESKACMSIYNICE